MAASPIECAVRGDKVVGEAAIDSEGLLQSFVIVGRDVKRPVKESSID